MKKKLLLPLMAVLCLASCSKDEDPVIDPIIDPVVKPEEPAEPETPVEPVPEPEPEFISPFDVYFLNEGSWGMNDASLSALNTTTAAFEADIYNSANGQYLGDVAQAIVYGENHCLYVAVSESKYIAKLDAYGKELARYSTSDTENQPRSLLLKDGSLYASFYGTESDGGIVAKIDTASLEIVQRVAVGSYPEEIAEINGVIAVCNSGYSYGNTLSMIDVESFTVTKEVTLPRLNPQNIVACNGKFYCNTTEYDEFWNSVSKIIEIDPVSFETKEIAEAFRMCPVGDELYLVKQSTNYYTTPYSYENSFFTYDTKSGILTEGKFGEINTSDLSTLGIYAIVCNPEQTKLYICVDNQEGSAYVNSNVYVYDLSGNQIDVLTTGVLTNKVCFAR